MDADPIMKLMIPIVVAVSALALQEGALQEDAPPARQVREEHEWLGQYVGEWDVTSETKTQPGAVPTRTTSTERVRSIGPLWVVGEGSSEADGDAFRSVLTLGYDPEKKSFVGTWIDSVTPYLWTFTGQLDEAKKVLTLETEGPRWGVIGTRAKYRERHELVDADHRTTASSIQNEDGSWFTFLRTDCHRKK
jgi:hypothetical protein